MNTITVSRAKHINLTYSTQGKHTATWKDYSEKTVRRTIQLDQWHDTDVAALDAVAVTMYAEKISTEVAA